LTQLTRWLALIAFAGLASALTIRTDAACPARNPDGTAAGNELATWAQDQIDAFFPFQEGWEAGYDVTFATDLHATFNATVYTFDTFKAIYAYIYPLIQQDYKGTFVHGFTSVVGVPNAADKGGFVTLTAWEGGHYGGAGGRLINATDAAYMVIRQEANCSLKITEFRETTNLWL
jgi:hypothetical protein